MKRLVMAMALLAGALRAEESLQKQVDDLRETVEYIRRNYEPAEPVEQIKQVSEWVSPSGELFTERQKGDVSPTDGSPLTERVTYRKMKFARRELVSEKIDAAIQGAVDGHVVVGINLVGVYQNLVGGGDVVDVAGQTRSANRGAGTGVVDVVFAGKPMRNTTLFVDFNTSAGPGVDGLAPSSAVLNAAFMNGSPYNANPILREAWISAHTPAKRLGFQAGIIDLTGTFDQNLAANDETSQFLTGSFVNSPILGNPANGPGAILRLDSSRFSLKLGGQSTVSTATGITDDIYSIGELSALYHILGDGQVRVWGRQQPRGDGQPGQALGASLDQRLSPRVTAFGRYAKTTYAETAYDWAASAGIELGNLSRTHLKDRIGLAYGRNDLQSGDREDFSELYYKTVLTNNFTVSLHGQGVFNRVQGALAADALPNIFALGLRTQVSY
jgi:hypothetical protein